MAAESSRVKRSSGVIQLNEERSKKNKLILNLRNLNVKNVILVGNPGVGKSTLMNSLLGKAEFKSGFSARGITTILQKATKFGVTFIDTPGLDDVERKKEAGKEIEKALRLGESCKLLFVVTLEGGRVRSSDITTIKLILDSFKPEIRSDVHYSIIINKVKADERVILDDVFEIFHNTLNPKPSFMTDIQESKSLVGDDVHPEPPDKLIEIIHQSHINNIAKKNVGNIMTDNWDEVHAKAAADLEIAKEQIKELQRKLKDVHKKLKEKKIKRYKVPTGAKVHSLKCWRINPETAMEVLEYSPEDLCVSCANLA
jgi:GTPase SAR1 family protein